MYDAFVNVSLSLKIVAVSLFVNLFQHVFVNYILVPIVRYAA